MDTIILYLHMNKETIKVKINIENYILNITIFNLIVSSFYKKFYYIGRPND